MSARFKTWPNLFGWPNWQRSCSTASAFRFRFAPLAAFRPPESIAFKDADLNVSITAVDTHFEAAEAKRIVTDTQSFMVGVQDVLTGSGLDKVYNLLNVKSATGSDKSYSVTKRKVNRKTKEPTRKDTVPRSPDGRYEFMISLIGNNFKR